MPPKLRNLVQRKIQQQFMEDSLVGTVDNGVFVISLLADGTPQIFDHKVLNDEQWIFVIVRTCEALLERNRAEDAVVLFSSFSS